MRITKTLFTMIMLFLLLVPITVNAAESGAYSSTKSMPDGYTIKCSIVTKNDGTFAQATYGIIPAGLLKNVFGWILFQVQVDPGTDPIDLSCDITLTDDLGADVLDGALVGINGTADKIYWPNVYKVRSATLTLDIVNNGEGDGAADIYLTFLKP